MYLLNAGLPFAKLTVCMSNKELAGLSKMIKAYNTPFLDEASCRQEHVPEFSGQSMTEHKQMQDPRHYGKTIGPINHDRLHHGQAKLYSCQQYKATTGNILMLQQLAMRTSDSAST